MAIERFGMIRPMIGGGEMGQRVRDTDWSATPLGDYALWPQSLRSALSLVLNSKGIAALYWGPQQWLLYNDAYGAALGERHPAAFGRPMPEVLTDIAPVLGPQVAAVLQTGQGFAIENQPLTMRRHDRDEETVWTYSFSPVQGEDEGFAGVLLLATEMTQQKAAESAEQRSRMRLATAANVARLGTFDWHAVTDIVDMDGRSREIFDLPAQGDIRSGDVFARIAPESRKSIHEEALTSIGLGVPFDPAYLGRTIDFSYDVVHADGQRFSIRSSGRVIQNSDGTRRMMGVFSDVTNLRRAETFLREQNANLGQKVEERTRQRDLIWDTSVDLLSIMDFDGHILRVNPAWLATLGWTQGELVGRPFFELLHADDMELTRAALIRLTKGIAQIGFENRYRCKDGSYRWLSWNAVPRDGQILSVTRDITDAKAHADALRSSRERAATYFNFSEDYLFLVRMGTHGTIRFEDMNPACERAMGLVRAEVVGQAIDAFLPRNSTRDIAHFARRCLETRQPQTYQATRAYREGHHVLIEGRVTFVERLPDGSGLVLFSGHDVTEQRAIEDALRQSQKMEAVGQLTGGLAHDFNNLLTGVTGSLELLQTRIAQGRIKDVDRYVIAAQGAAKRAAALTHRLLAFSRRQTLDPKPTDVNRLVAGMEELIQRTVGPAITVEPMVGAAGVWPTLVDPGQLENALLNLCINARDAMPDGGKITIETANRWLDERAARDRDLPPGQYVSLCVSDTGMGMPPDVIAKAFDPFFTTKPIGQGTGLGLSMIYGFAKQSGGQARIYSEIGQGTMVCLYLPRHLTEEAAQGTLPELGDAPRAQAGETVLVVDDEPTVRMLVTEVLEDLGYTAIEAADGSAGLKVLQSSVRIDLLVTDVGLPGGMNGRQMADAARIARPDLKVLFITGYAENAVVSHGHLDPGMHVLTKPFAMEALASRIKSLIAP